MSSSGSHLSKELFELVKSIGESRSKQEEDKIILGEMNVLKNKIGEPNIPPKKMKEYLIRAIYIEMLGHDASFAQIHAINLAQSKSVIAKRVGYLTCTLSLSQESSLLLLLIATLQRDLQSPNSLEIGAALTTICKLYNPGMMQAVLDHIVRLANHTSEIVRKKAIMALHKCIKLTPSLATDYSDVFRRALCDKDPSVMGASLNFFYDMLLTENMRPYYKDLVPSFVVILKQIIDHRLPRDYDYHRLPAPWLQIRMLEILGLLGMDDKKASEQMYEILADVMRRADDTGINAGYAIVYQCLKTITQIYPNPVLIENAAHCISRFISSDNHNLKYTGITGLISIVKINPTYATQHQMVVVDCLEDTDETLKRKTLSLLFKMTNSNNVQVITDKLMVFLKNTSIDSHLKAELVVKVTEVAEKFAPDTRWYVNVMNLVFEYAGEHVTPAIVNNFVKLIDEWRDDPDIILFTLHSYLSILENANNVQDCMIQVAAWVLGEFSDIAGEDVRERCIDALCRAIAWKFEDDTSRGWILNALMKISGFNPSEEVKSTVSRYSSSRKEDIQQRCYEFAGVCTQLDRVIDFKRNLNMNIDLNMGFMDNYVQSQLMNGAMPYRPEKSRASMGFHLGRKGEDRASEAFSQLRLEPYEAPKTEMPPAYLVSSPTYTPQPTLGAPSIRPEPSELNVRSVAWTKEGYKGKLQTAPEPARPAPHSFTSTQAPPQFLPQTRAPEPRKPVQVFKSQKELEKERLAQSIFGGLGGDSQGSLPSQTVRPTLTPAPVQHKPAPQPKVPNNLLDL